MFIQIKGQVLEQGTLDQLPNVIVRLLLCNTGSDDCAVIDQSTTDTAGNYSLKIDRQKVEEYQDAPDFDHFALEVYFAQDGLCGSNRWATALNIAVDANSIDKGLITPVLPLIAFTLSDDPAISDRAPAALDSWSIHIKIEQDTCSYENQWVADHFQTPLSFRAPTDAPLYVHWQYVDYPANTSVLFSDSMIINDPATLPESTLIELKY